MNVCPNVRVLPGNPWISTPKEPGFHWDIHALLPWNIWGSSTTREQQCNNNARTETRLYEPKQAPEQKPPTTADQDELEYNKINKHQKEKQQQKPKDCRQQQTQQTDAQTDEEEAQQQQGQLQPNRHP